jgi:diguanylate cyclase (GGDEF)-like protein
LISNHQGLDVDMAPLATRLAREVAALHDKAFVDVLTGLPNQRALDDALARLDGAPFSVLVLDFDGVRAAKAAFDNDYARGGDVLIRLVADTLRAFATAGETAARMHTAGDEFCLLTAPTSEESAAARAMELEAILDAVIVPDSHRHLYRGASVGSAASEPGERPGATIARASVAMHARKTTRRDRCHG